MIFLGVISALSSHSQYDPDIALNFNQISLTQTQTHHVVLNTAFSQFPFALVMKYLSGTSCSIAVIYERCVSALGM